MPTMMVSTGLTVPVAVTARVTAPRRDGRGGVADGRLGGRKPPSGADGGEQRERRQPADQPDFSRTGSGRAGAAGTSTTGATGSIRAVSIPTGLFMYANSACVPQPRAR